MQLHKSKYLECFKSMPPELRKLQGDCLLVEEIPAAEVKTESGLILSGHKRAIDGFEQNRPIMVLVLAVGAGYYDEKDDKTIPTTSQPGDTILVGTHSIKWLSFYGPVISTEGARVGLARDEDVQQHWREGEYEAMYSHIDSFLKATRS